MTDNRIPLLIFSMQPVGSLEVFTMQSFTDAAANAPIKDYYWRDAGSPQGYGPFTTIGGAIEHHKWLIAQTKRPSVTDNGIRPSSVIRVDFQNKKTVT